MMKKLLAVAVGSLFAQPQPAVIHRGRSRTCDVAFAYRMGAGFPGDVNRTHPASIEPARQDDDTPMTLYGQAAIATKDADNAVRPFAAADTGLDTMWGVSVRPFPTQQTTGGPAASFGVAVPPTNGPIDILRSGYIMVKIPAAEAALAFKGGAVFVRCQNSPGADDPVGGFKAQADGGNTAALNVKVYQFNGPADAQGNVELCVNV